jgi:hypothetical protein
MTVAIGMGETAAGAMATLDLEELLATRLLVQGNSGSGKSHLLRRLLEQSAPWVQQTIIDPEGDFVTMAERYGHLVIDGEEHSEQGLQLAGERARIHRVSTVLNLEGLDAENQLRRAAAFLGGIFEVERDHWYPMLVVVDEAHLLGMERRQAEAFRDLERGHFMALGPALSRRPLGLFIGPTETQPPRAIPRLMPLPEAALEDAHAVILAAPPPEAPRPQRRPPRPPAPDLLSQLMAAKPAAAENRAEAVEEPQDPEKQAERRARLDRILLAILADPEAGFRAIGVLYQDFLVRCRIEALGSGAPDLGAFRRMLTRARAGISAEMAEDDVWQDVLARAAILPEDMQGIFMMIARAAREGLPCPGDPAIARAYGTRSLGRARRVLTYMEEQGLIVCQLDGAGRRIVTLVELAWATAPGAPDAEAELAE